MGVHDRALLSALDMTTARLAPLVGSSRTTVDRGVKADTEYLNASRLSMMLRTLREQNDPTLPVVRHTLCQQYPDLIDVFQEALAMPSTAGIPRPSADHNYIFVFSEFSSFRGMTGAEAFLQEVLAMSAIQVTLITSAEGGRKVALYLRKFKDRPNLQLIACPANLDIMPSIALVTDRSGRVQLFIADQRGFTVASDTEASRIKGALVMLTEEGAPIDLV
jgi:hypothetical protein